MWGAVTAAYRLRRLVDAPEYSMSFKVQRIRAYARFGLLSLAIGLLLWPAVLVHVILTAGLALTVGGHLRSAKALP